MSALGPHSGDPITDIESGLPAAPDRPQPSSRDLARFERDLVIGGRRVRIVQLGAPGNPALVFIHGIIGRWQHWTLNLPHFARDHHVIAIDLPGFGESEMPDRTLNLDVYVGTVRAVCGQLMIDRATLVGNSMGGLVAAITAKRHPELVDRLVVVDGAGFTTAKGYMFKLRHLIAKLDLPFKLVYRFRRQIARSSAMRVIGLGWLLAHPVRIGGERALDLVAGTGRPGFKAILPYVLGDRIDLIPGRIACPTLIVWGRLDVVVPRIDAGRYAKLAPNSRIELIESAGHLPMVEAPELFNARLDEFLGEPLATRAAGRPTVDAAAPPAA